MMLYNKLIMALLPHIAGEPININNDDEYY